MAFGINKEMESALENTATEEATATQTATAETTATTTEESTETTTEATTAATETATEQNTATETQELALNEDQVRSYFKSKGREVENIDDLFVEKVKEVNPYENISPELKSILDYNKETGRGLSDYQKLQKNINDIPVLDLAIEKAKEDIGMEASNEDVIDFIEEELNIDLSSGDELSTKDKIKLNKFVKEYKENLIASQEKYKTPLAKEAAADAVEMITLDNGTKIEKTVFDEHQKSHQAYIEEMKVAVDSVAKTSLSIEFDNNGTKETYGFEYEFDKEDKKSMSSLSEDLDQTVAKFFRTEKGFDHGGLAKGIWRMDPKNWEKEVSAIVNKAIAENTERLQANENNINFNRNKLPSNNGGTTKKDIFQPQNGFGVKFNI